MIVKSLEYSMIVKLLTEHRLEFLSLKGGCRGSSKCQIVGNHMPWYKFENDSHFHHLPVLISII